MKNILVTGAAGFIGSNFAEFMVNKHPDYNIIVFDKLTYAGNMDNLKKVQDKITFVKGDICDLDKVLETFEQYNIDNDEHITDESHVDNSIKTPFVFTQTNVLGTHTLLEAAKRVWGEGSKNKFVHISTDEVYGTLGEEGYFTETSPIKPNSPYSASKASSDLIAFAYHAARETGADVACASMLKIRPSYSKWTIRYTERQVVADVQEKFRVCRCPPDFYVMNKLLRREMLLRLGLRFRERVCYEDVEYTMRVLCEGGDAVTVPDVVYRYVVNATSITKSRQTPKKQQDKYLAHKAFVAYVDARGIRLDARFRRITRRSFGRWGLTWLKIKECGDRETYRLFDLIPVWRKRVTDKQACDGH